MKLPDTGNEAKSVKAPVKRLLTKHGWFWWSPPANQFGGSGISDIHAIRRGMFMVVETKYKDNDPTPLQMAFINSVRAEDHFGFVVRETTTQAFSIFLANLNLSMEYSAKGIMPPQEVGGPLLDAIKLMSDTEILSRARFEKEVARQVARDAAKKKG